MYDFYTVYGEKATGIEPTADLVDAVTKADNFELIVHDTDLKMDVYDIRKTTKWNARWIATKIEEKMAKEMQETESV